jgi:hypothetical protein
MSDPSSNSSDTSTIVARSPWRHLVPWLPLVYFLAAGFFWKRGVESWLVEDRGFTKTGALYTYWLTCIAVILIWPLTALVIHLRKHGPRGLSR